jgi:protein TonB
MRLVSFFILSLTVHASALVYPVSFSEKPPAELIQVTVLPVEQESLGGSGTGRSEKLAAHVASMASKPKEPLVRAPIEAQSKTDPVRQNLAAEAPDTISDRGIPLVSAAQNYRQSDDDGAALADSLDKDGYGPGAGSGGNDSGSAGRGRGRGNEQGASDAEIVLTQARYRDTPRPDYPESARREGREGRVLLRVLVDDQGRARQVEINTTSGSDALDRAAAEAIKRWRFHPARYGEQPIESWLRIPIEFRLADVKSR